MKFRYDKKDDVMMVWLSNKPVDFAEQNKNLIIHFSKDNKPVLLEILEASQFIKDASDKIPTDVKEVLNI